LSLKRDVALKVLPEELLTDASRLARLQREAEILASLNHANVAQIHGLERSAGRTALVMELVDGPTLAERIAEGPLPQREALDIALQLAAALEGAHERGIVHRDLKPANIKLTNDGTVKVLDFGIAKALDAPGASGTSSRDSTGPALTEIGVVLGTAAYMSPEQARGKPVDKRTDVWAFGCVLYEMLAGRAAFLGEDPTSTVAHVLERDPDMRLLPTDLPWSIRRTIELCLKKDIKERARDIGDVQLALEGQFAAPVAQNQSPSRRAWPVAAALAIGVLGAGAYWALRSPASAVATSPLPVTRFVITPPAGAPLSSLPGGSFALSPDGRRLAYLGQNATKDGVAVYLHELDALEPKRLPGTDVPNPWINMNPFFSPDGRSIAFTTPDGRIIRVGVDGAPPLPMSQPGLTYGAAWTADDTLIVSTGRRLERIGTDGGTPEPLLAFEDRFVANPSVLPGGDALLITLGWEGVARAVLLDLETKGYEVLIEGAQKAVYANSGHIVFGRGAALMAVPFDAQKRVVTGEPVALLDGLRWAPNSSPAFAVSSSGTLAYVPAGDGARQPGALVWVDRAGAVVGRAVAESIDAPSDPRLSPDGTRVALTLGAAGESRPWIYDLRGRPPVPLAPDESIEGLNAVWSPDGRELAFVRWMAESPIYTVPSSGNGVAQRTSANGFPHDWSAPGELLFSTETMDIRALPIAGGDARDVVATSDDEFDAALSPGGRWIAYVTDRTGQPEVWVQSYSDPAAAPPVRVSGSGGYEPRWSADGKELFYRQGASMYAVAVDTDAEFSFATPVVLFTGNFVGSPVRQSRSYDVARDGRFLMIQPEEAPTSSEAPASIVIVENWFEELKQRVPTK
jgi:serine/threonine-protein kinase